MELATYRVLIAELNHFLENFALNVRDRDIRLCVIVNVY
jgi:hypothetical protein